jgi:hypothetical protein
MLILQCTWPTTVQSGTISSARPSRQSTQSRQASPAHSHPNTATPYEAGSSVPPHTTSYTSNGTNIGSMSNGNGLMSTSGPQDWDLNSLAGMSSFDSLVTSDTPWDIDLGNLLSVGSTSTSSHNAGLAPNPGDLYAYTLPSSYSTPNHDNTIPGLNTLPTNHTPPGTSGTDLTVYNNTNYPTSHLSPINFPTPSLAARRTNTPHHNFNLQFQANNPMPTFNMPLPLFIPSTIPEPIEQIFPSADSKRIFQHVRSTTSTMVVALGLSGDSSHTGKNPFMAMALRTILMDATSHAQTAFRHALLSLGAAHVCHQYQKSSPEQCQAMRVRTIKSKRKALAFLSIDVPGNSNNRHHAAQTDLTLATCLTLCLRNVSPHP